MKIEGGNYELNKAKFEVEADKIYQELGLNKKKLDIEEEKLIKDYIVGILQSGVLKSFTLSAAGAYGSSTIAIAAAPIALISGTMLDFGRVDITLSEDATPGSTSLSVTALTNDLKAGAVFTSPKGQYVILSADAVTGATTISVYPIKRMISSGEGIWMRIKAVTAAVAASATSATLLTPLYVSIPNGTVAFYYFFTLMINNAITSMIERNSLLFSSSEYCTLNSQSRFSSIFSSSCFIMFSFFCFTKFDKLFFSLL